MSYESYVEELSKKITKRLGLLKHISPYRKPPTVSPGLIYFRKRFLMGLYKGGGGLYTGGLIHGRSFVLVINKSDINKSVINREINVY
jgi:hypothetical protein